MMDSPGPDPGKHDLYFVCEHSSYSGKVCPKQARGVCQGRILESEARNAGEYIYEPLREPAKRYIYANCWQEPWQRKLNGIKEKNNVEWHLEFMPTDTGGA